MRDYEIMLILPAEADESVVGAAVERITKVIETTGGKVGNIDRWGKRRFAFEIDDKTEGYYVVAKFTAEPPTQIELERVSTWPTRSSGSRCWPSGSPSSRRRTNELFPPPPCEWIARGVTPRRW